MCTQRLGVCRCQWALRGDGRRRRRRLQQKALVSPLVLLVLLEVAVARAASEAMAVAEAAWLLLAAGCFPALQRRYAVCCCRLVRLSLRGA